MRLTQRGRWMAAVLACGDGALLSHRSASELWGIGSHGEIRIDVTVPDRSGRRRPNIAIHRPRTLRDKDRVTLDGIPVTTPARTLLDLAGVVGPRRLEAAFRDADRRGLLDPPVLEELCALSPRRRGVRHLRALVAAYRPTPETRSALEHRFVQLCRRAGLPQPAVNVPAGGYEVDALWPAQRLVVELDGYAFHHDRDSFERDRVRDEALQLAGYRVVRVTHRRLVEDPDSIVGSIRSLLADDPPHHR